MELTSWRILRELKRGPGVRLPNPLYADNKGIECRNKENNSLLKNYNIKLYEGENEKKGFIIEHYNRTWN